MIYACHRTSTAITAEDLTKLVEIGTIFADEYLAKDLDREPPVVSEWDGVQPLPDGVARVDFCDLADNEEPNALAWHTTEKDAATGKVRVVLKVPCNRILAQEGGSKFAGRASISGAFTHELAEAMRDASCGEWSDVGDGKTELALENADPVQNFCFEITLSDGSTASVTAYVKEAYWDSESPADPTGDSLCRGVPAGCLTRHHQIADSAPGANDQGGGYGVFRVVSGEQEVGGEAKRTLEVRGNGHGAERARRQLAQGGGEVRIARRAA